MNDGGNFCEITSTIMAGSSTCKYEDGNEEMDEEWYAKRLNNVAKF
jgi:hypothetical protein